MQWNGKRYYALNTFLRERFGAKVGKLSLDAGFTCPNRDGTVSRGGCVFCGEDGSGTFAGSRMQSLQAQMDSQKMVQKNKWPVDCFIAYFQNYTGTYAPADRLRAIYMAAAADPEVCGLAVATRPDCIDDDVIDVLKEVNGVKPIWIELGLQTMHDQTAAWLNRGYDLDVFNDAVRMLSAAGIEIVVHMILGLPGETETDMMETADYIAGLPVRGVKLHLLHVIEGTKLHDIYIQSGFEVLDQASYTDLVIKCLERFPENLVIHRLTGDGAKASLVAPRWPLNKRAVLNGIDKEMKARDTWQSKTCTKA